MKSSLATLCSVNVLRIAPFTSSTVSGSPSTVSDPFDCEARARTSAGGAHRRVRRGLRLADSLELGLVLDAPPIGEELGFRRQRDAVLAQVVSDVRRKPPRRDGFLDAPCSAGVQRKVAGDDVEPFSLAFREQLVVAELLVGVGLDARLSYAFDLESGRHRDLLAVLLRVQERIRDEDRHLVTHLR